MASTNVLIIDDDTTFSNSFKRLLVSYYGVDDVYTCTSEQEATDAVNKSPNGYTHMFIDCVIPGSDGIGLSQTLHKINSVKSPNGKTFLLSGFIDVSTLPDDLSHISGTLKKPLDKNELVKHFEQKNILKAFDLFSKFKSIEDFITNYTDKTYEVCEEFIPILSQLIRLEFDGEIVLMTEEADSSVIFMSEGEFNYITNNTAQEPLGEQLVKNGYLPQKQLNQVLNSSSFKNDHLKIGNYLIKENLLSPHAVDKLIQIQTCNRFKKILKYKDFKVSFINEHIEKKNATLSFSDYFKCLKENLDLENNTMFSLSKKALVETKVFFPTPQFAMIQDAQDISVNTDDVKLKFFTSSQWCCNTTRKRRPTRNGHT